MRDQTPCFDEFFRNQMMKSALIAWVTWAAAEPALASGAEGAGNPFAGDIGNALWTLIIFIIVLIVLGKFAWGPILGALQKREEFIHDSLRQAKKDREDAEASLKEYGEKLEAARNEATAIVDEGRRDAEEVKRRIETETRAEADRMVERARKEIALATETAVNGLYAVSAHLATEIAAKIIRKELDAKDHERLVAESIEELQAVGRE